MTKPDRDIAATAFPGVRVHHIQSSDHPAFSKAFDLLWREFGDRQEMESRSVLEGRFQIRPRAFYELVLLEDPSGSWLAVSDYTLISPAGPGDPVTVHLSHTLVSRHQQRRGLAGELLGFVAGRAQEMFSKTPVTLLAEAEHDDGSPERSNRLKAFEKNGLLKIDPRQVDYCQPDFSDPEDPAVASPLPLLLFVMRIGRTHERTMSGRELRSLVRALYWLYGAQFRPGTMAHPKLALDRYPADDETINLMLPTQG